MNLKKEIKNIRGEFMQMSFPKDQLEKKKPETVLNVLLNSLSILPIKEKKEIFVVNNIASKLLNGDALIDAEKEILEDAVFYATHRTVDGKEKGFYLAHVAAQVLEELNLLK